jgi:hypothetical protein
MVSPEIGLSTSPSSKATSAAISKVQRLESLPNSLGERWSISRKASACWDHPSVIAAGGFSAISARSTLTVVQLSHLQLSLERLFENRGEQYVALNGTVGLHPLRQVHLWLLLSREPPAMMTPRVRRAISLDPSLSLSV